MSENENLLGNNGNVAQNESISVQELVEATVRALISYDNLRTREPPVVNVAVPQAPAIPQYSSKELAALLPDFDGSGVSIWLERVDSVQQAYKVPDEVIQLLAIGKFTGQAKRWYQSKVEYVRMDWDTLKREVKKMYDCGEDPVELRKKMERRRWKKSEKFSNYYYEKVLLGNTAGVPESEMIHYVIDGFDDRQLKIQCRMMLANIKTLEDLFAIMNNVMREDTYTQTWKPPVTKAENQQKEKPKFKCFNCSEEGHRITECTKPRREKGSCFGCGSKDHKISVCPKKQQRQVPDSTTMLIQESVTQPYTVKMFFNTLQG